METITDKMNVEKYSSYKNSGAEWLGDIPKHWNTLSNKNIFKLKKNQVGKKSGDYVLLSLTLNGVIKRDMENPQGKFPAEFNTYQEVKKGDFIFCLFDVEETPRCVGLSDFDGMITGAYTVMEPNDNFDRNFLYYFYLNLDADKRLKPLYTGLRNTISKENFFSFKTFVPPLPEQTAIAAFLNRKTALIDQAIDIKQKQIELLKELRQILIHKAVTRGLNPNVKMKYSGNEAVGNIPEHWQMNKLRNSLKPVSIKNHPHLPLLSITRELGVIERNIDDPDENHNFIPDDLSGYKLIKAGQFGMNKMKAWQGSYGISQFTGIVSPAYFIFDLISDIVPFFFHLAIRSKFYVPFFVQASDGVRIGQWDLSKERMKEIPIIIPPAEEQIQIVTFIERATEKILTAISAKEQEIEKLKEYKATLINSAVTGKIKVFNDAK
jgi:type I restriction enzyme S subunit